MKSIAAVTLFASVALAGSASLIPTGISTSCSEFFSAFDADTSFKSCTESMNAATGAFAPSSNSSAASSVSAAEVKSALASVCSANTCTDSTIRTKLADFYQACGDELTTSSNKDVIRTYDVLYSLTPLKNALCSKGDDGNYCVCGIASTTSKSSSILATVAKYLYLPISSTLSRRADAQAVASIAPNATTFTDNNLLFLMLSPELSSDKLCQPCTRSVITSYISFESSTPYAPGLANSVLLPGQTKLYQAVQNTCGSTFLSGAVAAAAGLSGGLVGQATDNGASSVLANTGVIGALMGAVAMVVGNAL